MTVTHHLNVELPDVIDITPMRDEHPSNLLVKKAREVLRAFTAECVVIGHALTGQKLILVVPDGLATNMVRVREYIDRRNEAHNAIDMNLQGNVRVYVIHLDRLRSIDS